MASKTTFMDHENNILELTLHENTVFVFASKRNDEDNGVGVSLDKNEVIILINELKRMEAKLTD